MNERTQVETSRRRSLARLLGGASVAVLVAHGPAMAQSVDATVDSTNNAFTTATVTGYETVSANTQASNAAVTSTIAAGAVTSSVAGAGTSEVVVESNALSATSSANTFDLTAQQLGTAGAGSNGTLGLLVTQYADGGSISSAVTASDLTIDSSADATASSLAASSNTISATTTINQASSVFSDTISADLASDLAQSAAQFGATSGDEIELTRGNLAATATLQVTGGASVVANSQAIDGAAAVSSATITGSEIDVTITGADATNSAISVAENELRSTLTGNDGTAGTNLTVDTAYSGSAGAFTQQQIGDGDTITLSATTDTSALAVNLDDTATSALTVSENVLGAAAFGNTATLDANSALVDGTSISVTATSISADDDGGQVNVNNTAGTVDLEQAATPDDGTDFGFVAVAQQSVSGDGSIEASSDANTLTVTGTGGVTNSDIDVNANTTYAIAGANLGGSSIDLTANSIDASAALVGDQNLAGTAVTANLGDATAFGLGVNVDGDVTASAINVDGNLSVADADGNVVANQLTMDADTALTTSDTIADSVASVDRTLGTIANQGDVTVTSNQNLQTSVITSVGQSSLTVDIGAAVGPTGAIAGSSVTLDSNVQQVTAGGNTATSGIDLDANSIGTATDPVVTSLAGLQQMGSNVSGTSNRTLSLGQVDFSATTAVTGSTLSVDTNENRTTATGNVTSNTVAVTADTALFGLDASNTDTTFDTATGIASAGSGNSIVSQQEATGTTLTAAATTLADVTAGGALATTAGLTGSEASISGNITMGTGTVNQGTNTLDLDAGTTSSANGAVMSAQVATTAADVDVVFDASNAAGTEGLLVTGPVASSTLSVNNNTSMGAATQNQVTNTLTADATTIDGSGVDAAATAELVSGAADETSTVTADFGLANVQSAGGTGATSNVTLDGAIVVSETTGGSLDGTLTDSSATISGNTGQSDIFGNVATNSIAVAGVSSVDATSSLGNTQISSGGVTGVATSDFDVSSNALTDSTVAIDANRLFDAVTGNRATNDVSVSGTSISGDAAASALASASLSAGTETGGLSTSSFDQGLASVQESGSAVSSTSSFDSDVVIADTTAGATDSSLSISDNFARSLGTGNEAANTLGVAADGTATGVNGLAAVQEQTAAVSADSDLTGTVLDSVAGGPLSGSTVAMDDNISFARAMGNTQTNTLSVSGATIAGVSAATDGATLTTLRPSATAADTFGVTGDNVLASSQIVDGAITGDATAGFDSDTINTMAGSSVSASGNIAQSNVTGNFGQNALNLAADTTQTGVSALASLQESTGAIDSDASVSATLNMTGAFGPQNSTVAADGNVSFATGIANDAINSLSASGNALAASDTTLGVIDVDATGIASATSETILGNRQESSGASVTSTADATFSLLDGATGANDGSVVSGSENVLDSTAIANRASNSLVLNADTAFTQMGALVNAQTSSSAVGGDVRLTASLGNTGSAIGTNAGSSLSLRDNTGIARAAGNDATNVLNASAGTSYSLNAGGADAGITSGALNLDANYGLASSQVNSGVVVATASLTGTPSTLGVETAALNGSTVDLSGNRLLADAVSNRVVNTMTVAGLAPTANLSTSIATRQVSSGGVTSRVDAFGVTSTNAALTGSSVGLDRNSLGASASGNVAVTRLIRD